MILYWYDSFYADFSPSHVLTLAKDRGRICIVWSLSKARDESECRNVKDKSGSAALFTSSLQAIFPDLQKYTLIKQRKGSVATLNPTEVHGTAIKLDLTTTSADRHIQQMR